MGRYRIIVDKDLCQGHSVCRAHAPEIFSISDAPGSAYPLVELIRNVISDDLLEKAEVAAQLCPNAVIKIVAIED